jgi:hypothetical protein
MGWFGRGRTQGDRCLMLSYPNVHKRVYFIPSPCAISKVVAGIQGPLHPQQSPDQPQLVAASFRDSLSLLVAGFSL